MHCQQNIKKLIDFLKFYLYFNYSVKLTNSLKTHSSCGNISQPAPLTTGALECHVHPVHTGLLRKHNKLSFRKRSTVSHKLALQDTMKVNIKTDEANNTTERVPLIVLHYSIK